MAQPTNTVIEINFLRRKIDSLEWQLAQAHELINKLYRRQLVREKIAEIDPDKLPMPIPGVRIPIVYP